MNITLELTDEEATALAAVVRVVRPEDYDVDAAAWYRALDKLLPQLPAMSERVSK